MATATFSLCRRCAGGEGSRARGVACAAAACAPPPAARGPSTGTHRAPLGAPHAQAGALRLTTEFGRLLVSPGEIAVVPRGIRFSVGLELEPGGAAGARGYVLEVFGAHFALPELGPLGSNGLAAARDFLAPAAAFADAAEAHTAVSKLGGALFASPQAHSPFDVVAWHGNYYPYKYDLAKFCAAGSVSFDHPDPSIFTVLSAATDTPGVALADFVIFPPRWMVAERTFRPPWFHRNVMTEFMGMVWGKYDAKVGFVPGGASLHAACTPHGPDAPTFARASAAPLAPDFFGAGLAFMFETCRILRVAPAALAAPSRDAGYADCWAALPRAFDPSSRAPATPLADGPPTGATGAAAGTVYGDGTAAAVA